MRYWVFTEDQLVAALAEYLRAGLKEKRPDLTEEQIADEIKHQTVQQLAFMGSDQARRHKLIGGE